MKEEKTANLLIAILIGLMIIIHLVLIIGNIDRLEKKCEGNFYNIIVEVEYEDGSFEEMELLGRVEGNFYIGPDNPYPDIPKIDMENINGKRCLLHYPDCTNIPTIVAWNVSTYRIIGTSESYCDCA